MAAGLIADAGAEDPEHPNAPRRGNKLQAMLADINDEAWYQGMYKRLNAADGSKHYHAKRLEDLRHKDSNKTWLWGVNVKHGATIADQEEYVEAVRCMLGVGGPQEPRPCKTCGTQVLDSAGAHASKCCTGEATR